MDIIPDNVSADYVVDASEAVRIARANGIENFDVEVNVSIINYNATGADIQLQGPVDIKLDLAKPKTAQIKIPYHPQGRGRCRSCQPSSCWH